MLPERRARAQERAEQPRGVGGRSGEIDRNFHICMPRKFAAPHREGAPAEPNSNYYSKARYYIQYSYYYLYYGPIICARPRIVIFRPAESFCHADGAGRPAGSAEPPTLRFITATTLPRVSRCGDAPRESARGLVSDRPCAGPEVPDPPIAEEIAEALPAHLDQNARDLLTERSTDAAPAPPRASMC